MEACLFPLLVPRARIVALLAISRVLCTNMVLGFYLQVRSWQLTEVESGEITPVTVFPSGLVSGKAYFHQAYTQTQNPPKKQLFPFERTSCLVWNTACPFEGVR